MQTLNFTEFNLDNLKSNITIDIIGRDKNYRDILISKLIDHFTKKEKEIKIFDNFNIVEINKLINEKDKKKEIILLLNNTETNLDNEQTEFLWKLYANSVFNKVTIIRPISTPTKNSALRISTDYVFLLPTKENQLLNQLFIAYSNKILSKIKIPKNADLLKLFTDIFIQNTQNNNSLLVDIYNSHTYIILY